jgi:hypothetical protein
MSMPWKWTITDTGPLFFIPCGTSAIARPRWPALPAPVAAMCFLSAPPHALPPCVPRIPSSRMRSIPPTRPSLTFARSGCSIVAPVGSGLAPVLTPSGISSNGDRMT